jgi:hypothetical protein
MSKRGRPLAYDPKDFENIGLARPHEGGCEGLGYRQDHHVLELVRARGSVGSSGNKWSPLNTNLQPSLYHWLDNRDYDEQSRHHIDNQGEAAMYGDISSGDSSHHLTVLVWNAGDLDRAGISTEGLLQDSLAVPFICGKHHLALIQESFSKSAWRSFNTHGFRYAYSYIETCEIDKNGRHVLEPGNLLILAGASGHKNICLIDQGSIVNPGVSNPTKIKAERLWYFAASVSWSDVEQCSVIFPRAGKDDWKCCTVHLNNVLANKTGAAKDVLKDFWQRMLDLKLDIVAGDFNGSASDAAEQSLKEVLQQQLSRCGGPTPHLANVVYNVFRAHAKDCILLFAFSYNGEAPLQMTKSTKCEAISHRDLGFRAADKDWHVPLFVTFRKPGAHKRKRPQMNKPLPVGLIPSLQAARH